MFLIIQNFPFNARMLRTEPKYCLHLFVNIVKYHIIINKYIKNIFLIIQNSSFNVSILNYIYI